MGILGFPNIFRQTLKMSGVGQISAKVYRWHGGSRAHEANDAWLGNRLPSLTERTMITFILNCNPTLLPWNISWPVLTNSMWLISTIQPIFWGFWPLPPKKVKHHRDGVGFRSTHDWYHQEARDRGTCPGPSWCHQLLFPQQQLWIWSIGWSMLEHVEAKPTIVVN